MTKRKCLTIRVVPEIESTLRRRAAFEGRSVSEYAEDLIKSALNNPSGSWEGSAVGEHGAGPPRDIDTDKIREAVSEAVMEVLKAVGPGLPPKVLRYLVQDTAKTENLLRQISRLLSESGLGSPAENYKIHEERVRIAEQKSARILKKLKLDAIADVDRLEIGVDIKVSTKEETAQMLKEMGIIGEDGRVMGAGGEK